MQVALKQARAKLALDRNFQWTLNYPLLKLMRNTYEVRFVIPARVIQF